MTLDELLRKSAKAQRTNDVRVILINFSKNCCHFSHFTLFVMTKENHRKVRHSLMLISTCFSDSETRFTRVRTNFCFFTFVTGLQETVQILLQIAVLFFVQKLTRFRGYPCRFYFCLFICPDS